MKKLFLSSGFAVIFLLSLHVYAPRVSAACNWSVGTGSITAVTCGVDAQSTEAYDYSATADAATNPTVLSVPPGVTITLNAGAVGVPTTLVIGRIMSADTPGAGGTGIIVASSNYVTIYAGSDRKCYVADADGDGYSPTPNTCTWTSGVGKVRKNSTAFHTGIDCGDGRTTAHPGQTTYDSTAFTNTATGLSYDYNCNGVETKISPTVVTCNACTNGSGYASYLASAGGGYIGSAPACGASGTYNTYSTSGVCQDPAQANCAPIQATTNTVAQSCL